MNPLTTAELEEIRASDAALGEGPEALQLWPVVYTQRRALLTTLDAVVKAHEAERKQWVRELPCNEGGTLHACRILPTGEVECILCNEVLA